MVATVPSTTVSWSTGGLLLVDEVQADPVPAGARIAYLREVVFAQHGTGEGETPPPERQAEEEEEEEEERDEEEEARARGRAPLTSAELNRFRMIMEQERQQMVEEVATNNGPLGIRSEPQPDIDRAQDLEMVATHASVEGLRLPPDLIALAYDRNDGDIVNAIMNLTEPIFRRQLERELAERQAEAAEEEVVEEEEAEDDFEEDLQARQRELDLWLLESQVPGCTREHAERAYEQGREDVSRALPLARVAALLTDHECMVAFLMEQLPGSTRWEASFAFDEAREDVVEAAIALHRRTQQRLNQPVLSRHAKQRLRTRTVFMLALLYREWYGQLEREAEEALERWQGWERRAPLTLGSLGRAVRATEQPAFRTPDGSVWTHTRQEGWTRRAPLTPGSLGRAVRATEQLADAEAARGHAQTAIQARRTADGMRTALADDDADEQAPPSPQSPLPPALHTQTWSTVIEPTVHYERHHINRQHGPLDLRHPAVERRYRELRDQDTDNTGSEDEPQPPALAAASSSSEDEDGAETPTAEAYARPRPFVRGAVCIHPQDQRWEVAKRNLRFVQEQLDTEMASAVQGAVMSEGGYIAMMNAIKALWEQMSPHPGPDPVEVN